MSALPDTDRRHRLIEQYVSIVPVEVVRAETAVTVLDTLLESLDVARPVKTSPDPY